MNDNHHQISTNYEHNSFQRLFWESQFSTINTPKKLVRWHPAIIKWCIFLRHKSASAYETLRSSCINLPSQRTLRDYTHYFNSSSGFSADLDMQLIRDSHINTLENYQRQVCLIADEMHIKEGLVYNKFTGNSNR